MSLYCDRRLLKAQAYCRVKPFKLNAYPYLSGIPL
jgi:hypothetical protein